jgi:zinc protease
MKPFLFFSILGGLLLTNALSAQVPVFHEYTLPNGLRVFLQEDRSQPNAMGAVIVKGGSKCDPPQATGIAHYFEHMMFKGTDSIGTLDYAAEKIYLDSIEAQYQLLGATQDPARRNQIQKKINQLSQRAAEYAIPNEFDRLVSHFGGTGLNAFTSEDNIVYFNTFPGDKAPLWIKLYAHRFVNPVFRMFQSELETVYEEKNLYADFAFTAAQEKWQELAFPQHPYGTQTILGSAEHLKNPSLTRMREYFDKYYVPANMALVMTGNFDTEQVIHWIDTTFGEWEAMPSPLFPNFPNPDYQGVERTKVRMTPIRVGGLLFKGVSSSEPDALKLQILSEILSNEGQHFSALHAQIAGPIHGQRHPEALWQSENAQIYSFS